MTKEKPYKDFLERLAGKHGRVYYPFVNDEIRLRQLIEKDFPGFSVQFDARLRFTSENHPEFHQHAPYTVRYAPHCVRLPKHPVRGSFLDCIIAENGKEKTLGYITIDGEVVVWSVMHFPKKAAQLCGFDDQKQMIITLASMYNTDIPSNDTLSLYTIGQYYPLKKR